MSRARFVALSADPRRFAVPEGDGLPARPRRPPPADRRICSYAADTAISPSPSPAANAAACCAATGARAPPTTRTSSPSRVTVVVSPNLVAVCRHSTSRAGCPRDAAVTAALRASPMARRHCTGGRRNPRCGKHFHRLEPSPSRAGEADASLVRHCIAASASPRTANAIARST